MWSGAGNILFGGAGDLEGILSMGAGDPLGFLTLQAGVRVIGSEFIWDIRNATSRQSSPVEYSQQGGALIDVVSTISPWPAGTYKIRVASVLGQTFPQVFPNAHSGIEGKNDEIVPIHASVLRFAMPRVPLGVYSIRITHDSQVMEIPDAIRAVPDPSSLEVNRFRGFFNVEVYSKRGPVT
jgi:hypothetical protein